MIAVYALDYGDHSLGDDLYGRVTHPFDSRNPAGLDIKRQPGFEIAPFGSHACERYDCATLIAMRDRICEGLEMLLRLVEPALIFHAHGQVILPDLFKRYGRGQ